MASKIPFVSTMIGDFAFQKRALHEFGSATAASNLTWVANLALYAEIYLPESYTFTKIGWMNDTVGAHNIDVGVYNSRTLQKIRSAGSTLQAGSNDTMQTVSVTSTTLPAGRYLLALARDTTLSTAIFSGVPSSATTAKMSNARCFEQTSAFPLPATAAPVAQTSILGIPVVILLPPGW